LALHLENPTYRMLAMLVTSALMTKRIRSRSDPVEVVELPIAITHHTLSSGFLQRS
jgi:hypothetical protein